MISVCIITFNQAAYIEECLASVIRQKCECPIEIIVGDDASTDGTKEILKRLTQQHSQIRVLSTNVNLGAKKNFRRVLEAARGEYVALLEGDDYWVGDDKLQVQLSTLRRNPRALFCASNAFIEVKMFGVRRRYERKLKIFESGADLRERILDGWFGINTCTFFMKNSFLQAHLRSPMFRDDLLSGDGAIAIHAAHLGEVEYLPAPMATYRVTPGSIMNSGPVTKLRLASEIPKWSEAVNSYLGRALISPADLNEKVIGRMRELGFVCLSRPDFDPFQNYEDQFYYVPMLAFYYRVRRRASLLRMWLFGSNTSQVFDPTV